MSRDVITTNKSGAGYDLVAGNDVTGPVIGCVFWDREGWHVWRTDPEPRWVITDRAALETYLKTCPGNLRPVIVGDEAEVLGVLLDRAPISSTANSTLTPSRPAPSIEKVKSGGALPVKPDAVAASVIEGLIKAGLLTWDGQRALPTAEERAS